MSPRTSREPRSAPLLWLAAGAGAGLLLAAVGLLREDADSEALPPVAVARVNGALILKDAYRQLLTGLESDTREAADPERRRHVLDRMIEEELLVQRALELGLAGSDRRVRGNLVSAMIAAVTSDAESAVPEPDTLRRFFDENRAYFTRPPRLRVRQIYLRESGRESDPTPRTRAESARRRLLGGAAFGQLKREVGDLEVAPIPDTLLPPAKLREYIGPAGLEAALALEPGSPSPPVPAAGGFRILELVERDSARTPALAEIRPLVEAEWSRREGERALRAYLDELRDRSEVRIAPGLP